MGLKDLKIKNKLHLFLSFLVAAVVVENIVIFIILYGYLKDNTENTINLSIKNIESRVDNYFMKYIELAESLAFVAKLSVQNSGSREELNKILKAIQERYSKDLLTTYVGFEEFSYKKDRFKAMPAYETTKNGVKKVTINGDYDHKKRVWYRMAKSSLTPIMTLPYIDATTDKTCITIAAPIRDNNRYIGTAAVDVTFDNLSSFIKTFEKKYLKNRGFIMLVSPKNRVVYHSKKNYLNKELSEVCKLKNNLKGEIITAKCNCTKSKDVYIGKSIIKNIGGYSIYVVIDQGKVNFQFKRFVWEISIISLIIILVVWYFHLMLNRYVLESIQIIQKGLFSFFNYIERKENKIERINIDSADEFGQMAYSLNHAIYIVKNGIKQDEKVIEKTITILEEIQQGNYDPLLKVDIDANNEQVNILKNNFNIMISNLASKVNEKTYELEELNKNLEEVVKLKTKELADKLIRSRLTGLYNIVKLREIIDKTDKELSLLFLDIQNFNQFNYAYGVKMADEIIAGVADALNKIVPKNGELFHFSGDRFAIILFEPYNGQAESLVKQIDMYMDKNSIYYKDIEIKIGFHIGIVENEFDSVIKKGIIALAESKLRKGGRYSFYKNDKSKERSFKENILWMKKIKKAVENDYIIPFFQPVINNKTKKVEKFEALARMMENGDKNKIITPAIFLKHAKRMGLIPKISRRIIEKTFKHFKDNSFQFSINVTDEDFLDPTFVPFVKENFELYSIEPNRVIWEILETVSLKDEEIIVEQIKELKELGTQIAIDDFGSEYSNFSRLLNLQVDIIKIDGSFIRNLDVDENSYKIVNSIVAFAKSIDAKVVAEYVHSDKIFEKVCQLGIDYSQGYHFSPLPVPEIPDNI